MKLQEEKAIQSFRAGLNCAQAIMTAYSEDLRTEEGQKYIKEHKLHDTICEKCIADAIRIVDELTSKYISKSLRDFIRESNKGNLVYFAEDLQSALLRLGK